MTTKQQPPTFFETRRELFLERPLPSSEESERTVLGAILLNNDLAITPINVLSPEDFYSPLHRRVFEAMCKLFDKAKPLDPILIHEELNKDGSITSLGGVAAIANLTYGLPHLMNLDEYVTIIRDHGDARRLILACNEIATTALSLEIPVEDLLESAESTIYNIRSNVESTNAVPMSDAVETAITTAHQRAEAGTVVVGLPSGFIDLDHKLQGFRGGQYVIVAARPSIGKTSLLSKILYNVTTFEQAPALLFSLEMSKEEIADRVICGEANLDSYLLRTGHLTDVQWEHVEQIRATLKDSDSFFIHDSPTVTVRTIRSELRRINALLRKTGRRIKVVGIDHVGLMNNAVEKRGRTREGEVSEISRNLKQIAREFDVTLIALSQLNRQSENRADHRPLLSELRESGSLEQDCDIAILLYREDAYERDPELHTGVAEVIIGKNRNGPTGLVKLHFARKSTRFSNLADGMNAEIESPLGDDENTIF